MIFLEYGRRLKPVFSQNLRIPLETDGNIFGENEPEILTWTKNAPKNTIRIFFGPETVEIVIYIFVKFFSLPFVFFCQHVNPQLNELVVTLLIKFKIQEGFIRVYSINVLASLLYEYCIAR